MENYRQGKNLAESIEVIKSTYKDNPDDILKMK